jgi:hypothetical protein
MPSKESPCRPVISKESTTDGEHQASVRLGSSVRETQNKWGLKRQQPHRRLPVPEEVARALPSTSCGIHPGPVDGFR